MRRRAFLTGAAALVLGCSRSDRPEDPVWGKQPCAHCAMLVTDKRYAAQAIVDGDRRFFDDVGCMVLWADERGKDLALAWVRDADKGGWVEAGGARYASGARTPMDFGFEAREGGTVGWSDVKARVVAKKRAER